MEAILDYRNYRLAVEWFGQGPEGRTRLAQHPSLMQLMKEVDQAQGFTQPREIEGEEVEIRTAPVLGG